MSRRLPFGLSTYAVFGGGHAGLVAAVIWHALRDCYSHDAMIRTEADDWLRTVGRAWWTDHLGLADELYGVALDRMMPVAMRREQTENSTERVVRPLRDVIRRAVDSASTGGATGSRPEAMLLDWLSGVEATR